LIETNTYTFDSFGELTTSTGTAINPFQYAGREFDPETGLYNNRARYYDPKIGRFDSEDPVRFKGGIDFYRYTHNDPVNRSDPDGLGASECLKALAEWAKAYANAQGRLSLFIQYGDKDPGHADALEQAKNRLDKATKDVMNKCNCDLKVEAAAVAAATAALAARIADAIRQVCAEDPEVCYAW
jgi:RHS repeat-associated protein